MSAYIVDRHHIEYLVNKAATYQIRWWYKGEHHRLFPARNPLPECERVGQVLWDECIASVSYQYKSNKLTQLPSLLGEDFVYRHKVRGYTADPVQVLVSCECYEKQSCGHPGWKDSEAKTIIEAIRSNAIYRLPGWDDAVWGAPGGPKHLNGESSQT